MSDAPELRHTFPARLRLKSPAQFKAVYDLKKSASDARLVVYAGPNGLPHPRLGLSVSRRVGNAVTRNTVRRRLREVFHEARPRIDVGLDLVLSARPASAQASYEDLKAEFARALGRLGSSATPRGG